MLDHHSNLQALPGLAMWFDVVDVVGAVGSDTVAAWIDASYVLVGGGMLRRPLTVGMAATLSAMVAMSVFGAGVASAKPYIGQTYEKAAAKVQSYGGTPVIATVFGSQLPTNECIVTNAYKSITLDSRGGYAHKGTWLFDLNCNLSVAQPGKPGNSAATPEGEWAKRIQKLASNISIDFEKAVDKGTPPYCESQAEKCQKICVQSGTCTAELLRYLASL